MMLFLTKEFLCRIGLPILLLATLSLPVSAEQHWVEVDTESLTLKVKRGQRTIARFDKISIGRWGAGFKRRRGDDITPIGEYKIGWINENSRFYRFFGFNYPSVANAKQALQEQLINEKVFEDIVKAHKYDQTPSQSTALGGQLGIHGLGGGDERIHRLTNWTHGCIALTNKQIDRLSRWLTIGTLVKVK